jgi:hypothetical protein
MTLISSDSLNPMLVRDLRQGLRSSRFTLVFLALHTGMAFFVVLGLLSGTGSDVARMLIQTLEMGLILFYILGLPMAATFALSSEFLDNRIDLLKLTHLSARSLVWGKWLSLVTQGLMVFASLLPYLILTYFFGSVDVPSVLESVVSLLAFSALLVAACVALSCFNNMIFRIVLILGLLGLTMTILDSMNGQSNNQPLAHLLASIHADPGIAASLYLVAGAPFLWLVMEFGAYFLSPTAENHDTPQRLILFGLIAIAGLTMVFDLGYRGSFVDTFLDRYFFLAGLLALWVLMFAAATNPSPYPDTYRSFMRFGLFGQFMGRVFLYPGWPSSAPFILLATAFFSLLAATWISLRGVSVDYSWFAPVFLLLPPAGWCWAVCASVPARAILRSSRWCFWPSLSPLRGAAAMSPAPAIPTFCSSPASFLRTPGSCSLFTGSTPRRFRTRFRRIPSSRPPSSRRLPSTPRP